MVALQNENSSAIKQAAEQTALLTNTNGSQHVNSFFSERYNLELLTVLQFIGDGVKT